MKCDMSHTLFLGYGAFPEFPEEKISSYKRYFDALADGKFEREEELLKNVYVPFAATFVIQRKLNPMWTVGFIAVLEQWNYLVGGRNKYMLPTMTLAELRQIADNLYDDKGQMDAFNDACGIAVLQNPDNAGWAEMHARIIKRYGMNASAGYRFALAFMILVDVEYHEKKGDAKE